MLTCSLWGGQNTDFLLVRNQVRGPTPASDNRNTLYGLMMAGVPAINTLQSEYMCELSSGT